MPKEIPTTETFEEIATTEQENGGERILREGVHPIVACIGSKKDFDDQLSEIKSRARNPDTKNVNYSDFAINNTKNGFKHAGFETYVISPIDSSNKWSTGFYDCTGIVAVGIDKETGKEISFMSHQDPKLFLKKHKDVFINDMLERLKDLNNRSEYQTIDITIFGGNFLFPGTEGIDENDKSLMENYLYSINLLSKIIKLELGFNPDIISGPKTVRNCDTAYFDNDNRRLYLVKPRIDIFSQPFEPDRINKIGKYWFEGNKKQQS